VEAICAVLLEADQSGATLSEHVCRAMRVGTTIRLILHSHSSFILIAGHRASVSPPASCHIRSSSDSHRLASCHRLAGGWVCRRGDRQSRCLMCDMRGARPVARPNPCLCRRDWIHSPTSFAPSLLVCGEDRSSLQEAPSLIHAEIGGSHGGRRRGG
jgi:hypothetical protein